MNRNRWIGFWVSCLSVGVVWLALAAGAKAQQRIGRTADEPHGWSYHAYLPAEGGTVIPIILGDRRAVITDLIFSREVEGITLVQESTLLAGEEPPAGDPQRTTRLTLDEPLRTLSLRNGIVLPLDDQTHWMLRVERNPRVPEEARFGVTVCGRSF